MKQGYTGRGGAGLVDHTLGAAGFDCNMPDGIMEYHPASLELVRDSLLIDFCGRDPSFYSML